MSSLVVLFVFCVLCSLFASLFLLYFLSPTCLCVLTLRHAFSSKFPCQTIQFLISQFQSHKKHLRAAQLISSSKTILADGQDYMVQKGFRARQTMVNSSSIVSFSLPSTIFQIVMDIHCVPIAALDSASTFKKMIDQERKQTSNNY